MLGLSGVCVGAWVGSRLRLREHAWVRREF